MKRLYLSFILCFGTFACGGDESFRPTGDDSGGIPRTRRDPDAGELPDPRGDASGEDAGSLAGDGGSDAGSGADAGQDAGADSSLGADAGASSDAGAEPGAFEGRWSVTLEATSDTTCTRPEQYEARIDDTWTFQGDTLRGTRLGPNSLTRVSGADVWNLADVQTADLEIVGEALRGTFVFYWDTCDVFYDVAGVKL